MEIDASRDGLDYYVTTPQKVCPTPVQSTPHYYIFQALNCGMLITTHTHTHCSVLFCNSSFSHPIPSLLPIHPHPCHLQPSPFAPSPSTPQIYRLSVDNCGIHSSCLSCVQSANPLCGWCSTEGRCMPTNGCSMANTFTSHNHASSCPAITNVSPRQAYIVNNETVSCTLQCYIMCVLALTHFEWSTLKIESTNCSTVTFKPRSP